ncbi:MAG: flavocytochrome c [Raoultibacter sp.]
MSSEPLHLSRRSFVAGAGAMGALAMIGSLGLSGCAPKGDDAKGGSAAKSESYDIVIIGTGGAGMSAAISAYDNGATSICLLEKMGVNGGNTNFASSGMNASETKFQKEQGIVDSNALFAEETFEGGHRTANRELVDFMCDNSAAAIDWLDGLGIVLDNITLTGGMSVKRCHRPHDGSAVGLTMVPALLAQVKDRNIPIKMNCKATEFIKDSDGAVTGVKTDLDGKETTFNAKAIILATGGLGANSEMVTKYRPDLEGYVTTNQPGATGDGYVMAEDAGAELIQMDQIQIHPTVEQGTSTLIAEGVRGSGAILVNSDGNRFFDEMKTRDKVSAAELAQPGSFAWEIFDQQVYDANKAVAKYDKAGLVVKAANVAELAAAIKVDPAALQASIDAYNAIAASGAVDEFGRTEGVITFADGPMYAIKVAPGVHHEMGGVKINEKNEALDASGNPISGLYAAGEVTGGIHGNNRIGGNAVCDITVFGKNVGEVAARAIA